MKSIVYVSPYRRTEVSGGIKVCFQHVEMLNALGFRAFVYSPDGYPTWFDTSVPLFDPQGRGFDKNHIAVFPETINQPSFLDIVRVADGAAMKILFCQNQYYGMNDALVDGSLERLGFNHMITVGHIAARMLRTVIRPASLDVVPPFIDQTRFQPRRKELRIATVPRKLRSVYQYLRRIFATKHPDLSNVVWDVVENASESAVAETFGRAAVFLSLCRLECCPLTPLEAMASGCSVVGFHGYGGLEYATPENGIWLPNDYLEETADALAQSVRDFVAGNARYESFVTQGAATAKRFNRDETMKALSRVYGSLALG